MRVLPPPGQILGHPKGLFLLFGTEMWERFSYYGMRALLVLTLTASLGSADPGFGMSESDALHLYAWFTGMVWFSPILGGWLADNFIGQRRAVQIGSLVIAAGQFILSSAVPGNLPLFYVGLVVVVLGNGFFKANISTMVGALYDQGDARRDGAFTIFYMGINIGSFIAPLVCSTLGENPAYGWRYGFLSAGIAMLLAFVLQTLLGRSMLGDVGVEPSAKRALAISGGVKVPLTKQEFDRLRVIFTVFIFCVLFWGAYEQQGGLMNLYARDKIDRMLGGFEVPAGWFQSVNPFFIVTLGPIFAALWEFLGRRRKNPSSPTKMVYGLALTGLGFLLMVGATYQQAASGKANMAWLILALMFHTMGELCISPVGLSMTTKLAPLRVASLIMGVWFLTNFGGNIMAGYVGALAENQGDAAVFGGLAGALFLFAALLWAISGKLVRWMHGAETIEAPQDLVF
jgi:POT family proton-dependent oligopeptide transporter